MTNHTHAELLDLLDKMAQVDGDIQMSSENCDAVKELALILDDNMSISNSLTYKTLTDLVSELRRLKKIWSRKLGDTIILAAKQVDNGDTNGALDTLSYFVRECPSSFYRDIALTQIHNYKNKK